MSTVFLLPIKIEQFYCYTVTYITQSLERVRKKWVTVKCYLTVINEVIKMYKYQIDDNIQLLSQKIERNTLRLRPDYLEIKKIANEMIRKIERILYNNK